MLFLDRRDVADLLPLSDCIDAVEQAFGHHARKELPLEPGVLGAHLAAGGFHVKTAAQSGPPGYFAAKINANFPDNQSRHALPTIQGVIVLFDLDDGRPLALLDSIEITILRTAAASAVAARHLAREDARCVAIIGAGSQGRSHLRALRQVRSIERAFVLDVDPARAEAFAGSMTAELGITVTATRDLALAATESEICVTCTTARAPVFDASLLRPGHFIAAVGADSPEKQELEPAVLARCHVVVDLLDQAARMGELHHAITAGVMRPTEIHAELGQVVIGRRPGRTTLREMFVFDSTGTALQDVAATALVYERARAAGRGKELAL